MEGASEEGTGVHADRIRESRVGGGAAAEKKEVGIQQKQRRKKKQKV